MSIMRLWTRYDGYVVSRTWSHDEAYSALQSAITRLSYVLVEWEWISNNLIHKIYNWNKKAMQKSVIQSWSDSFTSLNMN